MTIATPTGEGVTTPLTFTRERRCSLIDDLRIRQILLAPLHATIERLRDENFIALKATDSKRSAIEIFRRYDRTALPVVDEFNIVDQAAFFQSLLR